MRHGSCSKRQLPRRTPAVAELWRSAKIMKKVSSKIGRLETYKIEAARQSFAIVEAAHAELIRITEGINSQSEAMAASMLLTRLSWEIVDFGFRACGVLKHIRGLKHKDDRFKPVEKMYKELEHFRHYFQHLNNGISEITGEIDPILGVIGWAKIGGQVSFLTALGSIPPQTAFYSISYNTKLQSFEDGIHIYAYNGKLKLSRVVDVLSIAIGYLEEWLKCGGYLEDIDLHPTVLTFPAMPVSEAPFVRLKFIVTGNS